MEMTCMIVTQPEALESVYVIKKSVFTMIMPTFAAVMQRKCLSIGRRGTALPCKPLDFLHRSDTMLTTHMQKDKVAKASMIRQLVSADPMCNGVKDRYRSSSDMNTY